MWYLFLSKEPYQLWEFVCGERLARMKKYQLQRQKNGQNVSRLVAKDSDWSNV